MIKRQGNKNGVHAHAGRTLTNPATAEKRGG